MNIGKSYKGHKFILSKFSAATLLSPAVICTFISLYLLVIGWRIESLALNILTWSYIVTADIFVGKYLKKKHNMWFGRIRIVVQ